MLGECSIGNSTTIECYDNTSIPWPRRAKKKFTVAVEGNIGSGKSTFLKYFGTASKNVEIVPEPVDMWKNIRGHNTLDLMYKDSQRWSLTFQSYVQLTMLQMHTKKQTAPVKMIERSIYSGQYCFVENLYKTGRMPGVDYAVIGEWHDYVLNHCSVDLDLIVYIRTKPDVCLERIKKRNRKEEKGHVPLEYLESLHELHEAWLIREEQFQLPAPVLVLDGDQDFEEMKTDFEKKRHDILCGYL